MMKILRYIMNKVSGNQKDELQEEWIEIVQSLDELDNIMLAKAAGNSL